MPYRIRFHLNGARPSHPFRHVTGQRALVLRWIEAADPKLSAAIHAANQERPYTIGPLWCDPSVPNRVWFDVSSAVDWMPEVLIVGMEAAGAGVRFGADCYELAGACDVCSATWAELVADPGGASEMRFEILSPTTHHVTGPHDKYAPLPAPEAYFNSWMERWDRCAPWSELPALRMDAGALRAIVRDHVCVTRCRGLTERVILQPGLEIHGFVGSVTFALLAPHLISPEDRTRLFALARFSTYCGTGFQTSRGLGQTLFVDDQADGR